MLPHDQDTATRLDQVYLDEVFDRALRLIEEGRAPGADDLLNGHETLRARVEELIRLAQQVAVAPAAPLPHVAGFTILQELGRGGMGTVYLARQESLGGRPVALKVLPQSAGLSKGGRQRFLTEATALAKLQHPNIVAVHDVAQQDGLCAYAMEWVDGISLAALIDHLAARSAASGSRSGERPAATMAQVREVLGDSSALLPENSPVVFFVRIGLAIARALAAVHASGLLHRDVKPSNVLLRRDGTPLLADFGLVRDVESSLHTQAGHFAGTVAYAPPEQLRGDSEVMDARGDVYALGITLYHALTLKLPFDARDPAAMLRKIETGAATPLRKLNPRVPRDLETIVVKAMEPDPARRYQTADELAGDLERLLSLQPIKARRAGPLARGAKLVRRNRASFAAGVAGITLGVGLMVALGVYLFLVPGWVAEHVREARLALLDPNQANSIVSRLYWGSHLNSSAEELAKRAKAFDLALSEYDAALPLALFDKSIRHEREIVAQARIAVAADSRPSSRRRSAGRIRPASLRGSLRDQGLYAFLTGDYDAAITAWSEWEKTRDPLGQPDPLVDAALGILYLFDDQPARAYPRLQKAVEAFPNVGFLMEYLADAAAKCGDAERARRWLEQSKRSSHRDTIGAAERINAAILAAEGRSTAAIAAYRSLILSGPPQIELARLLERENRLEEAVAMYVPLAQRFANSTRVQHGFIACADRWWQGLSAPERRHRIRAALDEPHASDSLAILLRQYLEASREGPASPATRKESERRAAADQTSKLRFPISQWKIQALAALHDTFSSPSLQSLSLSELAERMEVEDMSLWNRVSSYPRILKELQFAAWRSPWPRIASRWIERFNPRRRMSAMASAAFITTLAITAPAPAQSDFDYDFESLTTGQSIGGQDGWFLIIGQANVAIGPGVNSTKTVNGLSGGGSEERRPLPAPFYYTTADTAVVWTCQAYLGAGGTNKNAIAGPFNGAAFGITRFSGEDPTTYLNHGIQEGDTLAFGHWYEFRLTVDFSVGGGSATLGYRDLTLGETEFVIDGTLQNINLGASADAAGRYQFTEVFARQDDPDGSGNCFVDNIHLDAPLPLCTAAPCFQGLGDLPGGAYFSRGYQISADGSSVVGDSMSASSTNGAFGEPFRWRADTGMVGLGDLPGQNHGGPAYGVSADGALVCGWSSSAASCVGGDSAFEEGFRWTQADGMVGLGVGEPSCCESYGYGMADDGTICGAVKIPGCVFAMAIATNGNGLTPVTSVSSNCYGISRNAQWVVGESNNVAARWSAGTGLESLSGLSGGSFAFGVANDGAVVGRNGSEAFLWTPAGGVTNLGDLPGGALSSLARKTSTDGSLIVGDGNSSAGSEAVIWDQTRTLHRIADVLMANGVIIPAAWTLQAATGITTNGNVVSICGLGANPQGDPEAWIARFELPCGDLHTDFVVDLEDHAAWLDCQTVPDGGALSAACERADFDADNDADLADFAAFANCFAE